MTEAKAPFTNCFGQPVGQLVEAAAPGKPAHTNLSGQHGQLQCLSLEHAKDLYAALGQRPNDPGWTYLPYGPFETFSEFTQWLTDLSQNPEVQAYAVVCLKTGRALGVIALIRIFTEARSLEIGHVHFSNALKKTALATETVFLLINHAVDSGYRRVEWKCHNFNQASKKAALRFGFEFEGVFKNAAVVKQRSRDTAWFSVVDSAWPKLKAEYLRWLDPSNFDADSKQLTALKFEL